MLRLLDFAVMCRKSIVPINIGNKAKCFYNILNKRNTHMNPQQELENTLRIKVLYQITQLFTMLSYGVVHP